MPQNKPRITVGKILGQQIKVLKQSLKNTQDELEKSRLEKTEFEKRNILLESKLKDHGLITFLEFLSSAGFGFALSYLPNDNWHMAVSVGIPAAIIYIICIVLTKK